MAYQDSRPGSAFFSTKQPTFMVNLLLLLIVVGIAIIIFLLLFWFPRYWGWGGKVIGADGKVMTGGGIVVNAACCEGNCPPCTPTDGCEENCRTRYANSPTVLKTCIEVECNNGEPCERSCWKRYASQPTAYASCIRQECTPTGTPMYPQTPTCEENCRQKYPNQPTAYESCARQCGGTQTAPNSVLV
jgi:hypothetical protein